jgi:ABC-2 type transport system ATP-binding protein
MDKKQVIIVSLTRGCIERRRGIGMVAAEPIVSVRGLTKRFGDSVAVDNLCFNVFPGEIFGFLGPNGAGKSTTLNIISTLLAQDSGEVSVAGYDTARDTRRVKALLGLVPQDIALFGSLNAYENVRFFAGLYGLRGAELKAAVIEALGFVGLSDSAKKRASKMSGGMRRRLNIACGIAHHPRIIILDEPTVGVDAQSREHIMNSIRVLRERGATIIYTSHYMPEVAEICDRIAIIDHGRLVAQGSEQELLQVVTDIKTITVSTTIPTSALLEQLAGRLQLLPNVRRVAYDSSDEQLRVDVSLDFSDLTPLVTELTAHGLVLRAIASEAPDLETTFLALTGYELRQVG